MTTDRHASEREGPLVLAILDTCANRGVRSMIGRVAPALVVSHSTVARIFRR